MKKMLWRLAGVFVIAVGIAGLFLPVIPGLLLIFVGLSMLSPRLSAQFESVTLRFFIGRPTVFFFRCRPDRVRAGFTTRHFPVKISKSEDLANPDLQDLLRRHLPLSARVACLEQVHGSNIVLLDHGSRLPSDFYRFSGSDGLLSCLPEVALVVLSADCLPIYFWQAKTGEDTKRWIGLVHAGWRGTQAGVAAKAFKEMLRLGCKPKDIRVAFGPCIRWAHYEVGGEFEGRFPVSGLKKVSGKLYFDLAGENKRQLVEAGATPDDIFDPGICPFASNRHFFSFRKEKDAAGRSVSFISQVTGR